MEERAYTLQEARELIASEERAEARRRQIQRNERQEAERERRLYFARQRFCGLIMAVVSILLLILTGNLVCLVFTGLGVYIGKTEHMVIVNDYFYQHGGTQQWK